MHVHAGIFFLYVTYLFFFFFNYLLLAALTLRCCGQAFSSCSKQGLPSSCSVWTCGAGLSGGAQALGLQQLRHMAQGLQLFASRARAHYWGTRAQPPWGMWGLPRPETEPVFPALQGWFLTAGPPEQTPSLILTEAFVFRIIHPPFY